MVWFVLSLIVQRLDPSWLYQPSGGDGDLNLYTCLDVYDDLLDDFRGCVETIG